MNTHTQTATALRRKINLLGATLLCGVFEPASAALNDVFPADFVALPAGRTVSTLYLYDRRQEGTWAKGQRSGDLSAESDIAAWRISRYYQVGEWKIAPLAVLSASHITLAGNSVPAAATRERSGLGDLRLGMTGWLIDDPQSGHYLGLNLMTVWPTGHYENRELANVGENRRRYALSLGWVKALGKGVTLDLTPELAWYGTNPGNYPGNVRLQQSRTLSATGYLRYRFTPEWQAFVGAQLNEDGQTTQNGVSQNNPIHGRRYYLGATYRANPNNTLNLRLAQDESVFSGFKTTREWSLRWVSVF